VSVMVPQSFERRARDILREAEVVLPGKTIQPNAPLRADVNQGSQSKRADLARSEDRAPEGRESRLVWRIVVIVLAVLIALAVLMAGLIVGPFLGR
jgi:Flp pilus assembly protein TadB